jgi:hypothetical protein
MEAIAKSYVVYEVTPRKVFTIGVYSNRQHAVNVLHQLEDDAEEYPTNSYYGVDEK